MTISFSEYHSNHTYLQWRRQGGQWVPQSSIQNISIR